MWTSTQIQNLSSERAMWVNDCMMNEKQFDGNQCEAKQSSDQLKESMSRAGIQMQPPSGDYTMSGIPSVRRSR